MGSLLELEARPARSEVLFELKELYLAREVVVKDRTAARNRGKALTLSLLKRQNAQRLEQIDRQIATVEAAILQIVEADESLADRFAILISIPGVSITAFALLIAMPELGSLEAGQAANLAGLAPIARQSGRWTGRSFIRGGRADVRQALYMPALVAARFNPDMKAKYAHLIKTGKPAKSRPDRDHAKAGRPRKCPPKGKSHLDPKNRLINTDTLASRYPVSLAKANKAHIIFGSDFAPMRPGRGRFSLAPRRQLTEALPGLREDRGLAACPS